MKWWQKAVFYQVYPRSFADSNGDGIGDLEGLIQKLDYLKDLGIGGIWLSPHYPSPLFDCGYDVADYEDVAFEYGSLADFQRLLEEAHSRQIGIIIDLVMNHTSDQHPWFLESRASRDNPKRDWYIWRDGQNGEPPNNWPATFGGPAWEYDPHTGQYYYHFFFKQQPDLNWRNPAVKAAMFGAVRFWLDMGVDGFRIDAIGTVYEDPDLKPHTSPVSYPELLRLTRSAQADPAQSQTLEEAWKDMFRQQVDQPGLHALIRELRAVVDEYPDRVLIGETEDLGYHGRGDELHMVFNFPLMKLERLTGSSVHRNQVERLSALAEISPEEWPANTLGNHDTSRVYSRLDDGQHADEWARLGLALLATLRGTPFLFNGEEIGMRDLYLEDLSQFRDMLGVWYFHAMSEHMNLPPEEAVAAAACYSRDRCRTPLQWSSSPNAGFSPAGVETWLPVHPNYLQGVNAADQDQDPGSLLNFYRTLLRLRQRTPALLDGDYLPLHTDQADYLAFLRRSPHHNQAVLVILNFCARSLTLHFDNLEAVQGSGTVTLRPIFSSSQAEPAARDDSRVQVGPFEVFLAEVE